MSSWYDIEISDQIALDLPPVSVMQCHHLAGNRLVYAIDDCVRIVEGCLTDHQFQTLYLVQINRSLWVQQVQIFHNLLILQRSDGVIGFHDVFNQYELEPLNLYSQGAGFRACPYGIVISDFAGQKCQIWHWQDLLFKPRSDLGTEIDIPYAGSGIVIFSNLLVWSKGIAMMDSDKLIISNYWFRKPFEDDDVIDLK